MSSYRTSNHKYGVFTKLVNLVLPLSPILQVYGWGKFDFTFIATCTLAVIWLFCYKGIKYVRPKWFSIYLFYYLFVQLISATNLSSLIPLGWLRIFLVYGLFFSEIKYPLFIRYYTRIAFVCLLFWAAQYVLFNFADKKISGIIPFLPIALGVDDVSSYLMWINGYNSRICSFFSEPAIFAQFLFPILIATLFRNQWKYKWPFICFIVLCLLLLEAGNALVGLIVITIGYCIWKLRNANSLQKITLIIIIPVALFGAGYYYLKTEAATQLLDRQDQLNTDLSTVESGESGFIRIYRGYYVYDALTPFRKIIGVNNPELIQETIDKSTVAHLFMPGDIYFNTIQTVLIRTGIIGLIIFSIFIGNLFLKTNITGKIGLLTLMTLSFIASMYFTELMFSYIALAYFNPKRIRR